jgi:hypothetical protein
VLEPFQSVEVGGSAAQEDLKVWRAQARPGSRRRQDPPRRRLARSRQPRPPLTVPRPTWDPKLRGVRAGVLKPAQLCHGGQGPHGGKRGSLPARLQCPRQMGDDFFVIVPYSDLDAGHLDVVVIHREVDELAGGRKTGRPVDTAGEERAPGTVCGLFRSPPAMWRRTPRRLRSRQ